MSRTIKARVVGFDGQSPGPDSGITLRVMYELDGSIVPASGVRSSWWQWDDDGPWVDAQKMVGKEIRGIMTDDGVLSWNYVSRPVHGPCEPPQ